MARTSEMQKRIEERRKRVNISGRDKRLTLPPRSGYVRRWFNDEPNRVASAEAKDWTHIADGDEQKSMVVGVDREGKPQKAYAMEIPKEFYDDDQARKAEPLEEFEAQLRRGKVSNVKSQDDGGAFYADVKLSRD